MSIPASKVKAVCNSMEIALVRASRKPELEKLDATKIKQFASRARKELTKWQGLSRKQSRDRSRKVGHGESSANTALKLEIFQEALAAFEARLAQLESAGKTPQPAARSTKKARSQEHRATRAAIRKGMTAVEDLLNVAPAAQPVASAAPAPAAPKPVAAKKRPAKPAAPKAAPPKRKVASVGKSKQPAIAAAAKQSRVVRSGKTTRGLGHLKASTKRAQARRDSK